MTCGRLFHSCPFSGSGNGQRPQTAAMADTNTRSFLRKCEEFIRTENLVQHGDTVIAAVSGGIDSIVMLDVLRQLKSKLGIEVVVGHVNHCLRGAESDGDQEFVEQQARAAGMQCVVARVAVREYAKSLKTSVQAAARELRYEFLNELRATSNAMWIATAHHADDNAETLLLHLMRGSGLQGLRGIVPKRAEEKLIRPLLFARRSEIEAYARARKLKHREDSSNLKDVYARNFLRHRIMPLLEEKINPGIVRTLNSTARILAHSGKFFEDFLHQIAAQCVSTDPGGQVFLKLQALEQQPEEFRTAVLYDVVNRLSDVPVNYKTVDRLQKLTKGQVGKNIPLGRSWYAVRNRDTVVITPRRETEQLGISVPEFGTYSGGGRQFSITHIEQAVQADNKQPDQTSLGEVPGMVLAETVDLRHLRFPLTVRTWRRGDWFLPLGMKGRKKVSDFLSDVHVPAHVKKNVTVLCSGDDIVWVCGFRLDDRFNLTAKTSKRARLEFRDDLLTDAMHE